MTMSRIGIYSLAGAAALSIVLSPAVAMAAPIPAGAVGFVQSPASQANAVVKAREYLDYSAFSRTGLIHQLEYEKFSTADATYAVDKLAVNWNAQAAKKAKEYLDYSSFSAQGLYEQLVYEGFTASQAVYGVRAVGL